MNEIVTLLTRIDARLAALETLVTKPQLNDVLCKATYSCSELAELTQAYGVKRYRPFTVRLACKDNRIYDAEKLDGGVWAIPQTAVRRILAEGIPPERRIGSIH